MRGHLPRSQIWIVISAIALLVLASCQDSSPEATNPIVEDPDIEINVTPEKDQKYGYFTIVVKRVGSQNPNIGWNASGEVYIRVPMELGGSDPTDTNLLAGTGFGTAGFDASSQICKDYGGWRVEYNAFGVFNVSKCELNLTIEETWPRTEAFAECVGASGSASGGLYKLSFPSLKFTASDTREDTETTKDMITWINTFLLYPKDGLEDAGCEFVDPSP